MEGESTTETTVGTGEQTSTYSEPSRDTPETGTQHSTREDKPELSEKPKSLQDAIKRTRDSIKRGDFVHKDALDNKNKTGSTWERRQSRTSLQQQTRDGAAQNESFSDSETPQDYKADETKAAQVETPFGLTAQDREFFKTLTPEAQQLFSKYSSEDKRFIEHQRNELGEQRKALNSTYSTISPLMEAVGEDGDWMEALDYTTKWATELVKNPEEGVLRFLMSHGLTPDALMAFAAKAEEKQQRAPRKGVEVLSAENEVRRENEQLRQELSQFNDQTQEASSEETQELVEEFNSRLTDWSQDKTEQGKPKYPYLQYTEVEPFFWDELKRVEDRILEGELIPEKAFERAYKLAVQIAREENNEFNSFMQRQEQAQKLRPMNGYTSGMKVSTNIKPMKPQSMSDAIEMTRKQMMRR